MNDMNCASVLCQSLQCVVVFSHCWRT